MKPDRSLSIVVTVISALLSVPALLIGLYLAAARFPIIIASPTLLDLCLAAFWLWLVAAAWLASVLLRARAVTPNPFFGVLFLSGAIAPLGFLQALPNEWIYFSLPVVSAGLLLWRSGVAVPEERDAGNPVSHS